MPFYIPPFSSHTALSSPIHITDPSQTETLRSGDIVERWDNVFEWDEHCVRASELEGWRGVGDEVGDEVIGGMIKMRGRKLKQSTGVGDEGQGGTDSGEQGIIGVDLLEQLQGLADTGTEVEGCVMGSEAAREILEKEPPDDIKASAGEIRLAQGIFLRHSVGIMQGLLHFSLAGGFASPKITRVLQTVSYLMPPKSRKGEGMTPAMEDRTYTRLLETFQFVLDVMGCVSAQGADAGVLKTSDTKPNMKPLSHHGGIIDPGGEGWKAAVKVRLLHCVARKRILERLGSNGYNLDVDGVPINQEDMAATLGAFSVAPLWCLERLYPLPLSLSLPTDEEKSAWIATWRHIGFYLGIDPVILRTHFANPHTANKFLASTVVHLLTSDEDEKLPPMAFPTMPILRASSNRRPFPKTLEHHCALTRLLLGDQLSEHLGVPPTPFLASVRLLYHRVIAQVPVLFAEVYPRREWTQKRAVLTQEALLRVVRFQLGMRRTAFRPRNERGELGEDVMKAESVNPDPEGGRRLVSGYRALMVEMGVVILGMGMLVVGSLGWVIVQVSRGDV